jgi:hypothetical protein
MSKLVGFEIWETIGFHFLNYDLPGCSSLEEARTKVAAGTHRWLLGHVQTLAIVPIDYTLRDNESWLVETEPQRFSAVRV